MGFCSIGRQLLLFHSIITIDVTSLPFAVAVVYLLLDVSHQALKHFRLCMLVCSTRLRTSHNSEKSDSTLVVRYKELDFFTLFEMQLLFMFSNPFSTQLYFFNFQLKISRLQPYYIPNWASLAVINLYSILHIKKETHKHRNTSNEYTKNIASDERQVYVR